MIHSGSEPRQGPTTDVRAPNLVETHQTEVENTKQRLGGKNSKQQWVTKWKGQMDAQNHGLDLHWPVKGSGRQRQKRCCVFSCVGACVTMQKFRSSASRCMHSTAPTIGNEPAGKV